MVDTVVAAEDSEVHLNCNTHTENRVNFPIGVYAPHVARGRRTVPVGLSPVHTCVLEPAAGLPIGHPGR